MKLKTVFAVDDDVLMGELMALEMQAAGYDVTAFSSIRIAMRQMLVAQPSLLILDLNMPEMGGLEVLSALRAQGLLDRTVVLVLSGLSDTHIREKALQLGAGDYLVKPVTGTQLRETVARLLSVRLVPPTPAPAPPQKSPDRQINPVLADLTRNYGRATVARLLNLLSADLSRLQSDMPPDRETIGNAAHAVKGAAASLGFVAVEIACAALEHACEVGGAVEMLVHQAAHACARAQQEIDQHLRVAA